MQRVLGCATWNAPEIPGRAVWPLNGLDLNRPSFGFGPNMEL